ncbi:hypothetical protein F5B17DRAFT_446433 [Nemania serpens]|nr:hypothetical protein F5B17DRAFT_446433 [Nemania serpens]
MDSHQFRRCKWGGCPSSAVAYGGGYCEDHRRQNRQSRASQSNGEPTFPGPSSNPLSAFSRNPITASRWAIRASEHSLPNKLPSFGTLLPTKEKKQLSERHTARKSVKQQLNLEHAHSASPTSPVRPPSIDTHSANPPPVKKQRLSGFPNVSELYLRTDNSSFSENGIPHPSKRGMFRQSEERTYKLSAVDDFALRPKKGEAANESARSKVYNDQRQPHRGESRLSSSTRQTLPSSKPSQTTGLSRNISSTPLMIDLTGDDDDSEPLLPHSKTQVFSQNNVSDGIAVGYQKPQKLSDGNPRLSYEQSNSTPSDYKRHQDRVPQPQPGGVSQAQNTRPVEQNSNAHTQKPPQNTIPSVPTVQTTLKPTRGISSETPVSKQLPHPSALKNSTGPVSKNLSTSCTPQQESHLVNRVRQISLDVNNAPAMNSTLGTSDMEQIATRKPTTSMSTAQVNPIPVAPMSIQPEAPQIALPHETNRTQSPLQTVELTPVLLTDKCQPITVTSQSPLSALLGGREWKKMSPEERRLFWVSQHNPEQFDAQIYSENNRPFRPGDALFGIAVDAIPWRPKQPALHFDYIDPRKHYSHQESEAWYLRKQREILARGTQKTNLGKAVKRAVQRKRTAPRLDQKQYRDKLPQRVRDNPKWLASVELLERLEAQARAKKTSKAQREISASHKATATMIAEPEPNFDVHMESS